MPIQRLWVLLCVLGLTCAMSMPAVAAPAKPAAKAPAKPAAEKPKPAVQEEEQGDEPPANAPVATRQGSVSVAQVEKALQQAQAFLLSKQNADGTWEKAAAPRDEKNASVVGAQWGGLTAIATYSLLASGVSHQKPEMAKAIEFLKTADLQGTYALGLRSQVWRLLPQGPDIRKLAQRDVALYLNGLTERGFYSYSCKSKLGSDNKSTAQYGVLGMWGCERVGAEVPVPYWKKIEESWTRDQSADGGWSYNQPAEKTRATMTLAGVATLYVAQEYLNRDAGLTCKGNIVSPAIERGLECLSKHGRRLYAQGKWSYYAMYGVERVGVASGRKYFGDLDWYDEGAEILVRSQRPDGSWAGAANEGGPIGDTAFGILFLVRGRAPVVINKLEYAIDTAGDTVKAANWNQRPRDVANFTEWLGETIERDLNWQIVNLKVAPVADLHDSQILYISGNQPLQLGKEVEDKIKLFVEQGGMVVGHADCSHTGFADSFRKLGTKLFGGEFRQLPAEHPIFTEQFDSKKWRSRPNVQGLSNGVRELMIMLPMDDAGKAWQVRSFTARPEASQLMANIVMYSVDKLNLRYKGDSYIVRPDSRGTKSNTVKLARLEYPGNWNPEPGGWRRLGAVLGNQHSTKLDVETVKLGEGKFTGFKVAHLTGTEKLNINEKGKEELKAFVKGGGTLIVDAAGGSRTFGLSAEGELESIFGGKFKTLEASSPALSAAGKIDKVLYRRFARKSIGQTSGLMLKVMELNGRPVVFYSGEDLSAGLVGQPVDGIIGYDPATATAIMSNLVLFAGK